MYLFSKKQNKTEAFIAIRNKIFINDFNKYEGTLAKLLTDLKHEL